MVEFTLDGRKVTVNEGELIVHAAARPAPSSPRSATTGSTARAATACAKFRGCCPAHALATR